MLKYRYIAVLTILREGRVGRTLNLN